MMRIDARRVCALVLAATVPAGGGGDVVAPEVFRDAPYTIEIHTDLHVLQMHSEGLGVVRWDIGTAGAVAMSDMMVVMNVEPKGFTMPASLVGPSVVGGAYDAERRRFHVTVSGAPAAGVALALPEGVARVAAFQRNQLIFFAVDTVRGACVMFHVAPLRFRLHVADWARYEICENLEIVMGVQRIPPEAFAQGIAFEAPDSVAPIEIRGRSPAGVPFHHRYELDLPILTERIQEMIYGLWRSSRKRHAP